MESAKLSDPDALLRRIGQWYGSAELESKSNQEVGKKMLLLGHIARTVGCLEQAGVQVTKNHASRAQSFEGEESLVPDDHMWLPQLFGSWSDVFVREQVLGQSKKESMCIAGESLVEMGDGSFCTARNLKRGDRVASIDNWGRRVVATVSCVVRQHIGREIEMCHVPAELGTGNCVLVITPEHPVRRSDGQWCLPTRMGAVKQVFIHVSTFSSSCCTFAVVSIRSDRFGACAGLAQFRPG